jgi:hypothetical protein
MQLGEFTPGDRVQLRGSDLAGTVWEVGGEFVYVIWNTLSAEPLGFTEPGQLVLLPQQNDRH